MLSKERERQRRAGRGRARMRKQGVHRLLVFRSNAHLYAQIVNADGSRVLASASSLERSDGAIQGKKSEVAAMVGQRIAKQALEQGIGVERGSLAFDRSGYRYHGRVRALAEAAREAGLNF